MFQLWLDGREGTGDEDRSWLVILRVLTDIGRSDIIFEIQEHFDLKTKDIDRGRNVHDIVIIVFTSSVMYATLCGFTCACLYSYYMCVFTCMYVYSLLNHFLTALSLLCENTHSFLDDIIPVPTTSTPVPTYQGTYRH